jgi:hypothetical protein
MRKILRKFFLQRHNFAPNGPDLGEKAGQKRPVAPKKREILATCSLSKFICAKFSPALDFSPRGQIRRPFPFQGTKNLHYF